MNKKVACEECRGTRAKKGSQPSRCHECGGKGFSLSVYGLKKRCKKCLGGGSIVRHPCEKCSGKGVQERVVAEDIAVPQGVEDGEELRYAAKGSFSDVLGGQAGDLLVSISVKEHEEFWRVGLDVLTEVQLSLSQAILGCKITVETMQGRRNVNVRNGTNNGDEIRLDKLGMCREEDGKEKRGDMVVRLKVKIPNELSDQQRQLIEEFSREEEKINYYDPKAKEGKSSRSGKENQERQEESRRERNSSIFGSFKNIFS